MRADALQAVLQFQNLVPFLLFAFCRAFRFSLSLVRIIPLLYQSGRVGARNALPDEHFTNSAGLVDSH
jgi:hypothetical protein